MNKSDAIDKENYIPGEPIFTGDIDIPGMTEENAPVLQFLDCLKNIEKCTEIEPEKCGKILTEYARKYDITKKKIDRFITNYPIKIYKAIYETEVEYVSS